MSEYGGRVRRRTWPVWVCGILAGVFALWGAAWLAVIFAAVAVWAAMRAGYRMWPLKRHACYAVEACERERQSEPAPSQADIVRSWIIMF